ncbi:hypothetical protein BGW80DRAFT_1297462, partial [Lactifluus volemus]
MNADGLLLVVLVSFLGTTQIAITRITWVNWRSSCVVTSIPKPAVSSGHAVSFFTTDETTRIANGSGNFSHVSGPSPRWEGLGTSVQYLVPFSPPNFVTP